MLRNRVGKAETISMRDQYNREIDYMRISVTQDCNLQCVYCVSEEGCGDKKEILSKEELMLICTQAVKLGITNFKITGGEPLLRKDVVDIVNGIKAIEGVESVTLTTNGILLSEKLEELVAAGLDAVNVSLDTLDREKFQRITKTDCLDKVTKAVERSSKLLPTKINVVLLRGINEEEYPGFVLFGMKHHVDIRFIELMPLGEGKNEGMVNNETILACLKRIYPAMKKAENKNRNRTPRNGPAVYYHIPGVPCEIGFISAMNHKFCDSCNRIRLTAKGTLKGCLCFEKQADLWEILRDTETDRDKKEELVLGLLKKVIYEKPRMHSLEKAGLMTEKGNMKEIGG